MSDCTHRWASDLAREKGVTLPARFSFLEVHLGSGENEEIFDFDICVDCGKIVPMKQVRMDSTT